MHDAFRPTPTCPKCGTAAHSSVRIFATRTYERAIRKLLPEADRRAMEAAMIDPAEPLTRRRIWKTSDQRTGGCSRGSWPRSRRRNGTDDDWPNRSGT